MKAPQFHIQSIMTNLGPLSPFRFAQNILLVPGAGTVPISAIFVEKGVVGQSSQESGCVSRVNVSQLPTAFKDIGRG